jgi:hypothetical protein
MSARPVRTCAGSRFELTATNLNVVKPYFVFTISVISDATNDFTARDWRLRLPCCEIIIMDGSIMKMYVSVVFRGGCSICPLPFDPCNGRHFIFVSIFFVKWSQALL